ncbi:MAG: 50S ribosomal protein L17 [Planctomycetota bacterium]|nr:50S ribosomal protein L17 [Planctomycetota bacterium]MCZ6697900.1 50S ribosomal protein L17 [Planctomycetota bacterium]MCZ6816413.1 50S ribosomal protein L17 [Planctomycetota bacterium]
MRHKVAGRHLSRTTAHHTAMRRNMAQSLFQFGQIETTISKAKELRPFVERLITMARKGTLHARQRLVAELGDRAVIDRDQQEAYDAMSEAQRNKVLFARSGRRHRAGNVPAGYNKKKIPFVAQSVINKLMVEIGPRFADRNGGYTRIIRLAKRRIGDNCDLAILQLVGSDEPAAATDRRKSTSRRRVVTQNRIRRLEGKAAGKRSRSRAKATASKKPERAKSDVEDGDRPQPSDDPSREESK